MTIPKSTNVKNYAIGGAVILAAVILLPLLAKIVKLIAAGVGGLSDAVEWSLVTAPKGIWNSIVDAVDWLTDLGQVKKKTFYEVSKAYAETHDYRNASAKDLETFEAGKLTATQRIEVLAIWKKKKVYRNVWDEIFSPLKNVGGAIGANIKQNKVSDPKTELTASIIKAVVIIVLIMYLLKKSK